MFLHNFKYSVKSLFRNKMMIFWTFAFPIILGTFFNMAFSNIESSEMLSIIDIAIVDDEKFQDREVYTHMFDVLGDETNEDRLFNIVYTDKEEAQRLLEEDEITGYLAIDESPSVIINSNGINETIFEYVVREAEEYESVIQNAIDKEMETFVGDYANLNEKITEIVGNVSALMNEENLGIADTSSSNLSYTMIEFYTLIAMTCLYGGTLGMIAINQNLANMSSKGKRVATSPTRKRTLVFSSVMAAYMVQLMGVALLFLYTIFVLGVDYGTRLPEIVLLACVGSFAGLALGIAVATLLKSNEDTKTGIIIGVTMLGCFFSGMMGITMKYVVDVNVPLLNKINPANMITDGFYALYYYTTDERFYGDLWSLLIFAFVMVAVTVFCLRRQKYDSI